MSEHRRPPIPFSDAPRGTCRWCGQAIVYPEGARLAGKLDRRRRWHPACVDEYNLSDPREARTWLRRRQRGICKACGLDTYALRREIRKLARGRAAALRERGFLPRQSLWELDHVVPLIDGGSWDRSNLQTLCVPCHRAKTAVEARDRAVRRRETDAPASHPQSREPAPEQTPEPCAAVSKPRVASLEELLAHADEANARAEKILSELELERGPGLR